MSTGKKAGKVISTYVWVKRGGLMINTSTLPHDDPDSEYQQIIRGGGNPAEYGLVTSNSVEEECKNKSREQLIQEICDLRYRLSRLN